MLSRDADSLFWLSRYVERAENTARILDVREDRVVSGIRTRFPRPDGWPAA